MSYSEHTVVDAILDDALTAISSDVTEPNYDALARTADFVVIVVGEQVAAIANRSGIPAIGLSDITAWTATSGQVDEASNINPELLANVACNARGVIVLAPSDVSADPLARTSLTSLAKALDREAGIPAVYAVIPEPRKQQGKKSMGHNLDGWINSTSQSVVTCHLGMIWSKELRSREVRKNGGWIPMGFAGDRNIVYSVGREQIFEFSSADLSVPGKLINVAGMDYLEDVYGRQNKAGDTVVNYSRAGGDIASSCLAVGPYLPKGSRFSGVHAERGNVLVVNGAEVIWRTDGAAQDRFGGSYSYPRGKHAVGITPDTPQASAADMSAALEAFQSFNWSEGSQSLMAFGWLCNAFYTGAADWRVHLSVTGSAGAGKTTFRDLVGRLLGDTAISCDGDLTSAGIRSNLDGDAMVVLVDQADSTPGKVDQVLSIFRSASSSTNVLRADQRQGAINKSVIFTGMVIGVSKPLLNSEDQTRYVLVGIEKRPAGKVPMHFLLKNKEAASDLGKTMFARMVYAWPRYLRALDVFRDELGSNARAVQTLSPILAATWVALNDHEVSVTEAQELITKMNVKAEEERISQTSDEADSFDHLLGKVIKVQVDGRNSEATVAEAISMALGEVRTGGRPGEWSRSLGLYGLRACLSKDTRLETLYVNTLDFQFRQLYAGTKWAVSDMGDLFKRLPNASRKVTTNTLSIGGRSVRAVEITLPADLETTLTSRLASQG